MRLLYCIFIGLMKTAFFLGRFFNEKISQGYHGRKESLKTVRKIFSPKDKVIWMHAASLGEYEQGLPVLQQLKLNYSQHKILVTFFSPSGYENVIRKNHPADAIVYLPYDTRKEIQQFIDSFQPEIFFTVKYDYWYNMLSLLKEKKTKIFSVSANFYTEQIFFKPYGHWFAEQLSSDIDYFFHQTETSLRLAEKVGITNGMVSGDTRFDRVRQFLIRNNEVTGIPAFKGENLVVVFGSAWDAEVEVALELAKTTPSVKIIIAPHDLNLIPTLEKKFPSALRYSAMANSQDFAENVLLVDSIGMLSKLYFYADVSVVGGGFHSKGLHNILEAAVYGQPVLFGNHYRKNPEADALIAAEGGAAFSAPGELTQRLQLLLKDTAERHRMAHAARRFVEIQPFATEIIVEKIKLIFNDDYST